MCGIFAIYSKSHFHINLLIDIIQQLEHRGKDSFGISFLQSSKNTVQLIKSLEPFSKYNNNSFNDLKIAITHNRYSTVKNKSINSLTKQIQPIYFKNKFIDFHIVHNGNISNITKYITYDENYSDTQNILQFFNETDSTNFENKLIEFVNKIHCSYSIIILFNNTLYILRDSYGYKPLNLGLLNNDLCVVSEDNILNFNKIRDINPGEILKIDNSGYKTLYNTSIKRQFKCIFEYIYFMNQNSTYNNQSVYQLRKKLGSSLASSETTHFNSNNTLVIGSPNTAIPMGIGFAEYLNLPYKQAIEKQPDCGRTFILKNQTERQKLCKKFIFHKSMIQNKIIILVDDSLVRGNTIQNLSKLFYEYGCNQLHIRICSPPVKYPCYYGIDIPTYEELLINNYSIKQIEKKFNLNSLKYITNYKMIEVFKDYGFCTSCFTGDYNKELDW